MEPSHIEPILDACCGCQKLEPKSSKTQFLCKKCEEKYCGAVLKLKKLTLTANFWKRFKQSQQQNLQKLDKKNEKCDIFNQKVDSKDEKCDQKVDTKDEKCDISNKANTDEGNSLNEHFRPKLTETSTSGNTGCLTFLSTDSFSSAREGGL